jgi:hypothetical protein
MPGVVQCVQHCENAILDAGVQVWRLLQEQHVPTDLLSIERIEQDFYRHKMLPGEAGQAYVNRMRLIMERLRMVGIEKRLEQVISRLIAGLDVVIYGTMAATWYASRQWRHLAP